MKMMPVVRESPCASALLFCRSRGHETLIIQSCPSSVPSAKSAVHPLRLRSAIPDNCVLLAKSSEPSFRMTNEKFSMKDSQFRRSALVAACRAVSLRLGVLFSKQQAGPTPVLPYRTRSHPVAASQSDFILPGSRPEFMQCLDNKRLAHESPSNQSFPIPNSEFCQTNPIPVRIKLIPSHATDCAQATCQFRISSCRAS
jgi:hypothetical protein